MVMLEAGTVGFHVWKFSRAVKQGFADVQTDLATNGIIVTPAQPPATAGNPAPVAADTTADDSGWTLDLNQMSFPASPLAGRLNGKDFNLKTAFFRNGDLHLNAAGAMTIEILRLGDSIDGQRFEFQPAAKSNTNPRVKMSWTDANADYTVIYDKNYALKLEFDKAVNGTVSGKVYVCFPDDAKSYVVGTVEVKLPQTGP